MTLGVFDYVDRIEKENTELKEGLKECGALSSKTISSLARKVANLLAQIEKMKCHTNCLHWTNGDCYIEEGEGYRRYPCTETNFSACDCKKWELTK